MKKNTRVIILENNKIYIDRDELIEIFRKKLLANKYSNYIGITPENIKQRVYKELILFSQYYAYDNITTPVQFSPVKTAKKNTKIIKKISVNSVKMNIIGGKK